MDIRLIAHRGNLKGPNKMENRPDYLLNALGQGFDCEVDVWLVNRQIFLGHDRPEYQVEEGFLKNPGFWLHAKNLEALEYLLNEKLVCFWHENDAYTITSNGFIWANIDQPVSRNTILVSLMKNESFSKTRPAPYGICSDYVFNIRSHFFSNRLKKTRERKEGSHPVKKTNALLSPTHMEKSIS